MTSLLIVAGEASGDLHGARLLAAARRTMPGIEAFGLGGDELAAAGFDAVAHSSEIAVVGITEVLRVLGRARQIFRQLIEEVERRRPEAAVLIDSPEFNLRLAKELHARGVRVCYYISPQIWAWRKSRVRTIARRVDRMWVLFPFEVDFYRGSGVEAVWVGHPLVDEVPELPQVWDQGPPVAGEPYSVALLPGSRGSEIDALLPTLLRAVDLLGRRLPIRPFLVRAPTVPASRLEEGMAAAGVHLPVVSENRFEHLSRAHLAFCASGTATLELGLLGTPQIVTYRVGRFTAFLAKVLLQVPRISLVNLVLGRQAVPELLQDEATPEGLASAARELLLDPRRIAEMRRSLAELRPRLGASGAAERAASELVEELSR